ncbi:hypothetical protein AB1Y20_005996 [Prymnesium parvum]|uniref:Dehydrogenase/reductase SDR family member 7B n=1 Tax=Prymnesium parvum TaxID=97485 RepID=A0AB34J2N6_PRYPA
MNAILNPLDYPTVRMDRALLAAAGLPLVVGLAKLLAALKWNCDTTTACAKLAPGAYSGKVVWITGASSGIGREMARQLGALGAKLILTAREAEALEKTKALVVAAGASANDVVVLPGDMEKLHALPALSLSAIALFGGVDVLVNNAGVTQRETGANTAFEVDVKMANVNYLSCVCLAKSVLPTMAARGGGRIINISSIAGKVGVPLRTSYCGTKHAMIGFFDALRAEEFARCSGVCVTNICPGSVRTDIARNALLGQVGSRRGETDPNIEAGLDPVWVCERILSAASCDVDECWIATRHELIGAYVSQYLPAYFKKIVRKRAAAAIQATLAVPSQ